MFINSYKYLTIADVCEHNKLDYDTVMLTISNSSPSFGTNYDTLITSTQLERILKDAWPTSQLAKSLDFNNHDEDSGYVLISLGS